MYIGMLCIYIIYTYRMDIRAYCLIINYILFCFAQGTTQDLFELLERVQSSRLDDQRCVLPPYFSQVSAFYNYRDYFKNFRYFRRVRRK